MKKEQLSSLLKKNYKDRLELIKGVINSCEVKTFAEVGVWKGQFSKFILDNCPSVEKYYLIDPWRHLESWKKPFNVSDEEFTSVYYEAMENIKDHPEKTIVIRGMTLEVIDEFQDNSLDMVYIDADHTLKGILIDLMSWYPKVTGGGGILSGDDFVSNYHQHGDNFDPTHVKPVVEAFAEAKKLVLHSQLNQFFLNKT